MYMAVHMGVPGVHGGQRGHSDFLEMKLQTVVSQHVGDGSQFGSFGSIASALNS